MEINKYIIISFEVIFLIGCTLYFIFGLLSLMDNKELIEKMGEAIYKKIKKDNPSLNPNDLHKQVKTKITIEFFISSFIDLVLFLLLFFYNSYKSKNELPKSDSKNLSLIEEKKNGGIESINDVSDKRIYVFGRGSQFDLLVNNPKTFMWVSPLPEEMLERYNLVQRQCVDNDKVYKDVLIYKNDYSLTKLDQSFISELIESRRNTL